MCMCVHMCCAAIYSLIKYIVLNTAQYDCVQYGIRFYMMNVLCALFFYRTSPTQVQLLSV